MDVIALVNSIACCKENKTKIRHFLSSELRPKVIGGQQVYFPNGKKKKFLWLPISVHTMEPFRSFVSSFFALVFFLFNINMIETRINQKSIFFTSSSEKPWFFHHDTKKWILTGNKGQTLKI